LRIGIEKRAYGLNAPIWQQVRAALAGFCRLEDASDLVDRLRLRKSEQELRHVARAAELADDALREAHRLVAPGAFEGDILAAMQGAIFRGGGDFPASEWPIGSGPGALMVRYHSGRRRLDRNDQLQLEFASSYRRYHACLMRTVLTGAASARHRAMHAACKDALAACQARCRPGATMGEVFDAQARVFDDAGFREHRLNACGYSLGATYSPNWMDWPMFFTGNPVVIEPSSVFFLHMILLDSRHGLAMSLGETVRVTDAGCVALSKMPHELVVKP
jgi:Xaa-Pro dipeptidase